MSKWHELLANYAADLKWQHPATEEAIASVEAALNMQLPPSLKSFLLESNGLDDDSSYTQLVWPVEKIHTENLQMRSDLDLAQRCMTFDSLLFFGNPWIDGIRFGFPISAAGYVSEKIFAWYPIEDSRPCIEWSLERYLTRWLSGDLKI
ncbi:MAG: hypothetical protein GC204_16915 [Chloroflexi bacterium]|nr:hypothetical protein [Chloroflexota bacterium]